MSIVVYCCLSFIMIFDYRLNISDPLPNAVINSYGVYSTFHDIMRFHEAVSLCKMMNANLVALETQAEYNAYMTFRPATCWVYATDRRQEGTLYSCGQYFCSCCKNALSNLSYRHFTDNTYVGVQNFSF